MPALNSESRTETARYWVFLLFLSACFLGGGASRLDVSSLILLQPFAVACAAAFLLIPGPLRMQPIRAPLLMLTALAAIIAVQLIPLPPEIWTRLPGRAPFADVALTAGIEQPWRPISLTPDLTLASLVGLVVPFTALLGFASLTEQRTLRLLPFLIAAVGVSAFLGLAQIAGGPESPFYLYRITNFDSAVGFFSNRNHHVVLLAMAWPLLAVWITMPLKKGHHPGVRRSIAAAMAILLLAMAVAVGSRAGLVLTLLGIAFGWVHLRRRGRRLMEGGRVALLATSAAVIGGVAVVGAAMFLSRDEAIRRMLDTTVSEEIRADYAPLILDIARDFFPVGSGFGSFDPVFRYYEPFEILKPIYLNHAHNDPLELAMTGGLPAIFLMLFFVGWVVVRMVAAFRSRQVSPTVDFARLGAAMVVIMLLSSVVDYPLRTPLLSALCAVACGWLGSRFAPKPTA